MTFSDTGKSCSLGNRKEVIFKADKKLFGQMTLAAESRQLHMGDVLAHPIGPWQTATSLSKDQQGSPCKGT